MEHFDQFALSNNEEPNAVIVGLAPTELHYEKINQAFRNVSIFLLLSNIVNKLILQMYYEWGSNHSA